MCFTLSLQVKRHRLEKVMNARFREDFCFEPFYFISAFDFSVIPVVSLGNPEYFTPMSWGLIPYWVKTPIEAQTIKRKTLNARFESILEKPSFRCSAESNRCIVPATGFFEWQHINGEKIPWFIGLSNNEIMHLAGIYSTWTNTETGEMVDTFAIITVPANPLLEKIHNTKKRMPAILKPNQAEKWLDKDLKTYHYSEIIKPVEQDYLKAYTVSPIVSNPKTNRNIPEVLEPYSYPEQQLLF